MRARRGPVLGAALAVCLFLLAALVLRHELQAYRFRDIEASLGQIPNRRMLLTLAITLVNYLALTFYDFLAPLWSRLGAALFHHGERFHNFQGSGTTRRSSTRFGSRSTWPLREVSSFRGS